MRWGFALAAALCAPAAFASEDGPLREGVGRITVQGGWRLVANDTFYDRYASRPENAGLEPSPRSQGSPIGMATFAYAITDLVELGVDLFGTLERLQLTGQPRLTTISYGALLGLRLQGGLNVGPEGLVPFVGVLTGPLLASAAFQGQAAKETLIQAWGATVGATFRLTPVWGLTAEYRLVRARGAVEAPGRRFGTFNAGGSWFGLGITYTFPPGPSEPSRRF
ncbi:hypothetical protein SAMN05444354_102140 [Stigmatella aurantiaca]|uniref:Outer membrane protein beta-barrel domain-containing protein n=1 Tax=Stigmatella aurantiaca TaxID=41 RepID=A0A1H7J8F3_STIAU|nr:hypothetical protein [Stigmatella aurantiaca]SEK70981.1 hypothetical protein SAMN05444354_102140 [Stigmatella aurantiaca]